MRLKVRDLMRHIRAKGIENTRGCLTKAEVIDLLASVPTITLLMDDININDERPPEVSILQLSNEFCKKISAFYVSTFSFSSMKASSMSKSRFLRLRKVFEFLKHLGHMEVSETFGTK